MTFNPQLRELKPYLLNPMVLQVRTLHHRNMGFHESRQATCFLSLPGFRVKGVPVTTALGKSCCCGSCALSNKVSTSTFHSKSLLPCPEVDLKFSYHKSETVLQAGTIGPHYGSLD